MQDSTDNGSFGYGPMAAPAALLYGGVTLFRRWLYDRGLASQGTVEIPTISVGGLEVGGSGKTPITGYLLKLLLEAGKKPGLLSRGYGRQSRGVVVRGRGEVPEPEQIGDEPAMLVASGLDIPVAVCAKRLAGAQALQEHDVGTLVLDDGFAHRAMRRDLDIVVLRGEHPSGNGHLLPWGSLREPLSSLRRAGLLWFHFKEGKIADLPSWVREKFPSTPVVISRALVGEPKSASGEELSLRDARVIAASGIAFPEPFFNAVEGLGAELADKISFRDHHDFTPQDVQALRDRKSQVGAEWVVVTPKDAIKLRKLWVEGDMAVLGVDVEVVGGESNLLRMLGLN